MLQLGRVKDSFELDKMFFFLVNAADLASSAEELQGVVSHVEANLVQHGIRNPRIYPVSSLAAVEGKLSGDESAASASGIIAFERDFIRFTLEELTDIAVHSARQELNRAKATLEQWIAGAQAGEAERARQLDGLLAGQQEAVRRLEAAEPDNELKAVAQEVKELVYYVRQRTAFRFGELYNQAFNPAAFREEGLDLKEMLKAAYQDLINRIAFDLSQETLATTLRMEKKFANAKAAQKIRGVGAAHCPIRSFLRV